MNNLLSPPEPTMVSFNQFLILQGSPRQHQITKYSPRAINNNSPRNKCKRREIDFSNEFVLHGNSVHENSLDSANENNSRSIHGETTLNINQIMELERRNFETI